MGYFSTDQLERFTLAARQTMERLWRPSSPDLVGDLQKVWSAGSAQGWFDLATDDALQTVLGLVRVTGRAACPLPLMDGFLAARLLDAVGDFAADIAAGAVRVVAVTRRSGSTVRFAEAGMVASHVLVIPPEGGRATLHAIAEARLLPGLAVPPWTDLEPGDPVAGVDLDADRADEVVVLLRLALAVRALAAAEHAHETAVEHAKTRRQFGRAIGGFGAVQQRTATSQIAISAGNLLTADAVRRHAAGSTEWRTAAELAITQIAATARGVQQAAHYTLGAPGYFEGHAAPWLFRRVHADLACLPLLGRTGGDVADVLAETDTALPEPELSPAAEVLRAEIRSFLAERPAQDDNAVSEAGDDPDLVSAMAERGWLGMAWPAGAGGRGATLAEQYVLQDEVAYRRLPVNNAMAAVSVVGAPIVRHGTAEQRDRYLPLIREGRLTFCLGYSEPDATSDLAALTTSAVPDGDDWVISGRKAWITEAHTAQYIWLAVRTDPDATPSHAGISVFMVPMAAPGISTRAQTALSGQIASTVDFADVRVSDADRVGPVNRGWEVITDTLNGQRLLLVGRFAAALHRQLDDLLVVVRGDPRGVVGPRGSAARARLGILAAELQAVRCLLAAATRPLPPRAPSWLRQVTTMAGVLVGELSGEFGTAVLDTLGPAAALGPDAGDVPGGGGFEYGLRMSVLAFLGGGTNDLQRGLIARGLGLV